MRDVVSTAEKLRPIAEATGGTVHQSPPARAMTSSCRASSASYPSPELRRRRLHRDQADRIDRTDRRPIDFARFGIFRLGVPTRDCHARLGKRERRLAAGRRPARRRLRPLRRRLGQRRGLDFAVALRRQAFGSRRRQFGFGSLAIGDKLRLGVQPRDRRRPHEEAFDHVAVPMNVAHSRLSPNARPRARIASLWSGEASLSASAHAQPIAVCPEG